MAEPRQFQDLSASLRGTLMAAIVEAQRQGTATVEAEHLLLALAADAHTPAGALLSEFGLDHAAVSAALRTERERSLGVAGVSPRTPASLAATRIARPRWGASCREALLRSGRVASRGRHHGDRHRMTGADLLFGILSLELGTVARALSFAGVDRAALLETVMTRSGIPAPPPRGKPNRG